MIDLDPDARCARCGHELEQHDEQIEDGEFWCSRLGCACERFEEEGVA